MTSETQMREFWKWFARHASEFGETFENEALLKQLDRHIKKLGDFSWEMGPGIMAENAFTLSPAGNRELLAATSAIVAAAPIVPGWEFHSSKVAKHWEPRFELQGTNGEPVEIDATLWRCALLEYADGSHEVLVEASNLSQLSDDYRQWAAEIALDGLLGERCRMEFIDEVTVVPELSEREQAAAFPIADIRDRIR